MVRGSFQSPRNMRGRFSPDWATASHLDFGWKRKGHNWTACTNMETGKWHKGKKPLVCVYYQDARRNQYKSGLLEKLCNPCAGRSSYKFFQWDFEAVKKEGLCFEISSIHLQDNITHEFAKEWCTRCLAQGLFELHVWKTCVTLWWKTRRNDSLPFLCLFLSIVFSVA